MRKNGGGCGAGNLPVFLHCSDAKCNFPLGDPGHCQSLQPLQTPQTLPPSAAPGEEQALGGFPALERNIPENIFIYNEEVWLKNKKGFQTSIYLGMWLQRQSHMDLGRSSPCRRLHHPQAHQPVASQVYRTRSKPGPCSQLLLLLSPCFIE